MGYPEAIDWLYGTQQRGIKLGLENMRRLLGALEVPVNGTPAFIHVAGTNGKGSVCAMAEALCRAAGKRTALYTSPHLVCFRERIRVDGECISPEAVATRIERLREIVKGWQDQPTFFELTTAMALAHFHDERAEIVVLETGMGGRLDSTNVVTPRVAVITPISADHQQWLGHRLAEIAGEKAGIIKSDLPVLSAPQLPEVAAVLRRTAEVRGASLTFVDAPYEGPLGLVGSHQKLNAALALEAVRAAGIRVPSKKAERALANVNWPGRFQQIDPFVLDGGHNAASVRVLADTWREIFGSDCATVILGLLREKELVPIMRSLLPIAARLIAVPVRSPRSGEPGAIRDMARAMARDIPATLCASLPEAMEEARAHPERILITGSLFLVGEALAALDGRPAPMDASQ